MPNIKKSIDISTEVDVHIGLDDIRQALSETNSRANAFSVVSLLAKALNDIDDKTLDRFATPQKQIVYNFLQEQMHRFGSSLKEFNTAPPTPREKQIWKAATTLAHNICTQTSDTYNNNDETREAYAASECAANVRNWLTPSDDCLIELFAEANVNQE